jgi:Na+-driven multidrug efflux pump
MGCYTFSTLVSTFLFCFRFFLAGSGKGLVSTTSSLTSMMGFGISRLYLFLAGSGDRGLGLLETGTGFVKSWLLVRSG